MSRLDWRRFVLFGALVLLAGLTVAAWLGRISPLFEAVANVRLQLMVLGIIVGVGALLVRQWRPAGLALVLAAIQLIYVLPYWTATADPVPGNGELARIMQYNVWFGNDNYSAIAGRINQSDVDVVALQEITVTQWQEIEPLLTEHPYRLALPVSDDLGELGGGMALLSRTPLVQVPIDDDSNRRSRPIMAATTEVMGREVVVVGLHPHASRTNSTKVSLRQDQLATVAALATNTDLPVLLLTDMNMTPFSGEYRGFLRDTGWRDPHRLAGWKPTWPTALGPLGMPLDHIFVSDDFWLHEYEIGTGAGSDHRTLIATVSFNAR